MTSSWSSNPPTFEPAGSALQVPADSVRFSLSGVTQHAGSAKESFAAVIVPAGATITDVASLLAAKVAHVETDVDLHLSPYEDPSGTKSRIWAYATDGNLLLPSSAPSLDVDVYAYSLVDGGAASVVRVSTGAVVSFNLSKSLTFSGGVVDVLGNAVGVDSSGLFQVAFYPQHDQAASGPMAGKVNVCSFGVIGGVVAEASSGAAPYAVEVYEQDDAGAAVNLADRCQVTQEINAATNVVTVRVWYDPRATAGLPAVAGSRTNEPSATQVVHVAVRDALSRSLYRSVQLTAIANPQNEPATLGYKFEYPYTHAAANGVVTFVYDTAIGSSPVGFVLVTLLSDTYGSFVSRSVSFGYAGAEVTVGAQEVNEDVAYAPLTLSVPVVSNNVQFPAAGHGWKLVDGTLMTIVENGRTFASDSTRSFGLYVVDPLSISYTVAANFSGGVLPLGSIVTEDPSRITVKRGIADVVNANTMSATVGGGIGTLRLDLQVTAESVRVDSGPAGAISSFVAYTDGAALIPGSLTTPAPQSGSTSTGLFGKLNVPQSASTSLNAACPAGQTVFYQFTVVPRVSVDGFPGFFMDGAKPILMYAYANLTDLLHTSLLNGVKEFHVRNLTATAAGFVPRTILPFDKLYKGGVADTIDDVTVVSGFRVSGVLVSDPNFTTNPTAKTFDYTTFSLPQTFTGLVIEARDKLNNFVSFDSGVVHVYGSAFAGLNAVGDTYVFRNVLNSSTYTNRQNAVYYSVASGRRIATFGKAVAPVLDAAAPLANVLTVTSGHPLLGDAYVTPALVLQESGDGGLTWTAAVPQPALLFNKVSPIESVTSTNSNVTLDITDLDRNKAFRIRLDVGGSSSSYDPPTTVWRQDGSGLVLSGDPLIIASAEPQYIALRIAELQFTLNPDKTTNSASFTETTTFTNTNTTTDFTQWTVANRGLVNLGSADVDTFLLAMHRSTASPALLTVSAPSWSEYIVALVRTSALETTTFSFDDLKQDMLLTNIAGRTILEPSATFYSSAGLAMGPVVHVNAGVLALPGTALSISALSDVRGIGVVGDFLDSKSVRLVVVSRLTTKDASTTAKNALIPRAALTDPGTLGNVFRFSFMPTLVVTSIGLGLTNLTNTHPDGLRVLFSNFQGKNSSGATVSLTIFLPETFVYSLEVQNDAIAGGRWVVISSNMSMVTGNSADSFNHHISVSTRGFQDPGRDYLVSPSAIQHLITQANLFLPERVEPYSPWSGSTDGKTLKYRLGVQNGNVFFRDGNSLSGHPRKLIYSNTVENLRDLAKTIHQYRDYSRPGSLSYTRKTLRDATNLWNTRLVYPSFVINSSRVVNADFSRASLASPLTFIGATPQATPLA